MVRTIMRARFLRSAPPFVLVAGLLFTSVASAQGGAQSAIAEDLFRQAKVLMEQSKYREACEKFEGSQRLDPSTGTLLNLADCNEKLGKLASAWAQFGEASILAKRAGTADRAAVAQDRAKALEPRLSRVRIVVADSARVPGLELRRDDIVLDSAVWNGLSVTDTGKHVFKATAPGKLAWTSTVDVQGEGKATDVVVPPLVDAAVEAKPEGKPEGKPEVKPLPPVEVPMAPPPPPPPPPEPNARRTAGFVVGGIGVAGLAVGGILGLVARSDWKRADCPANRCKTAADQSSAESAKRKATASTVGFIAGGVLAAAGITLVLVSPDPAPGTASRRRAVGTSLAIAPTGGQGAAGFDLVGSF